MEALLDSLWRTHPQVLVSGRVSAQQVPSNLVGEWKQDEHAVVFQMFIFALGYDSMSYLLSFNKP